VVGGGVVGVVGGSEGGGATLLGGIILLGDGEPNGVLNAVIGVGKGLVIGVEFVKVVFCGYVGVVGVGVGVLLIFRFCVGVGSIGCWKVCGCVCSGC